LNPRRSTGPRDICRRHIPDPPTVRTLRASHAIPGSAPIPHPMGFLDGNRKRCGTALGLRLKRAGYAHVWTRITPIKARCAARTSLLAGPINSHHVAACSGAVTLTVGRLSRAACWVCENVPRKVASCGPSDVGHTRSGPPRASCRRPRGAILVTSARQCPVLVAAATPLPSLGATMCPTRVNFSGVHRFRSQTTRIPTMSPAAKMSGGQLSGNAATGKIVKSMENRIKRVAKPGNTPCHSHRSSPTRRKNCGNRWFAMICTVRLPIYKDTAGTGGQDVGA
jgi:hypothetical protein